MKQGDKGDYEKIESKAVEDIISRIPKKLISRRQNSGFFCDLFSMDMINKDYFAFNCCDGVGTKILLATAMMKFDTVGIDLVAMNANDAAVYGKVIPTEFMNKISCQEKVENEKAGDIIGGIAKGLEQCDISASFPNAPKINFGKGETASESEMLDGPREGYNFELSGALTGFIKKTDVPNLELKGGETIIGIKSSGPHSNGYTSLRHNLLSGDFEPIRRRQPYKGKHTLDEKLGEKTIGELLLEPTSIYVKPMFESAVLYPGIFGINITGYGLKNFNRIKTGIDFRIYEPLEPQAIFKLYEEDTGSKLEKMYEKFNMGMGFAVIVPSEYKNDIHKIVHIFKKQGHEAKIIGDTKKVDSNKPTTYLKTKNDWIKFEGYG